MEIQSLRSRTRSVDRTSSSPSNSSPPVSTSSGGPPQILTFAPSTAPAGSSSALDSNRQPSPTASSASFNAAHVFSLSAHPYSLATASAESASDFARFKLGDVHPRKQRLLLQQLREQELELIAQNIITPMSELKQRKDKDAPRIRSRDLDLPFKPLATSKIGKMLFGQSSSSSSKTNKAKRTPVVAFHLIRLAIIDNRESLAEQYLVQLPVGFLKKKRPYEANLIFLLAMSRRMERLLLLMLDRGFPTDVNSPIFTLKTKGAQSIPFRINASLFPSYFFVALAMGFETLVRYMIKLGANVNHSWYGLTPLHIASFSYSGTVNNNMLNILLDFGADPWRGVYAEQINLLSKLRDTCLSPGGFAASLPAVTPSVVASPITTSSGQQLSAPTQSASDPLISFPIMSVQQKPVRQYRLAVTEPAVDATSTLDQDKKILMRTSRDSDSELSYVESEMDKSVLEREILWRRGKFVLPVSFCILSGSRLASLALIQRMYSFKNRKSGFFSAPLPPASLRSSAASKNSNSNARLNSYNTISPSTTAERAASSKDSMCLLIQQDLEVTIYLLKSECVDIMQQDPRGANALHLATRTGNIDMVKVLLYFDDADRNLLNSRGENGWTALHEAVSRGHVEIFKLLLRMGADVNIKNNFGDGPLELGVKLGISRADLDQIWIVPAKKLSTNYLATVVNSDLTDLINDFPPRLAKLLNIPFFEDKKKTASLLLDIATSPMIRKASSSDQKPVTSPVQTVADTPDSSSSSLGSASATSNNPAPSAPSDTAAKKQSTLRIPFSKMFNSKGKKKSDTIRPSRSGGQATATIESEEETGAE